MAEKTTKICDSSIADKPQFRQAEFITGYNPLNIPVEPESVPESRKHANRKIPTVLYANVRAISTKIDEIQQIAELNEVDAICITETWLSNAISDYIVAIPGYNLYRKDRINTVGGGVCIYVKNTIPSKYLNHCDEDDVESIWLKLRPHKLPRYITSIILVVVYHSTKNRQTENNSLKEHIQKNLDQLTSSQPNALIIITGDFNPKTTGLKAKDITQGSQLTQLVKFKTRDSGILDWFLTNKPKLFCLSQLPKIGSSDHYAILSKPADNVEYKPKVKKLKTRDMRDSAWRAFGRWMVQKDWSCVLNMSSCEDKYRKLMQEICTAMDTFLPERSIKKHPTDRPWLTSKLKKWIYKRQKAFIRHGKNSSLYKFWRNKIQREIKIAKSVFYNSRVDDLEYSNPSKWWKHIKSFSGQSVKQEWHHQFLGESMDTESLAQKINDFFCPILAPCSPTQVADDFLVTEKEVYIALSSIKINKAIGPDNIPNRLLKDFAAELTPVIVDIYNQSLRERYIPSMLKSSIVNPIPKIPQPKVIESDIRPVSLTCTLAKIMEGFTCTRLLSYLVGKMDNRQYACRGRLTTDALIYLLQAVYEALDAGDAAARIFFADFSKGFDLIDHNVLISELKKLEIPPVLLGWISAFLTNRTQAVRIDGVLSGWKQLRGGIPQGTKLGVILFNIMTNDLLADWNLRIKFVDDTSALEIITRNSISLLDVVADSINNFAVSHNMKLNPAKCKDMLISFMQEPNFHLNPINLGNTTVQQVSSYKLLGVHLSDDLKWNTHVEYIYTKACKRLYALRILVRVGVKKKSILKVYVTIVRPILEYAVPVWQSIPDHLSQKIESIQKRALRIIWPEADSYSEALQLSKLDTLSNRRVFICQRYMNKMKCSTHALHFLLPHQSEDPPDKYYSLRKTTRDIISYRDKTFF